MSHTLSSDPLDRLTPEQLGALHEHARREAARLRNQAMADAAAWLARRARALVRLPFASPQHLETRACPR